MKKILFNATPTEKRAALLENDKVVELVVERPDSLRVVGNIYRGKIVSILPGIQSAFVNIGMEKASFSTLRTWTRPSFWKKTTPSWTAPTKCPPINAGR
jgi:Ribonuclease G/E